jgi:hypothetical protein
MSDAPEDPDVVHYPGVVLAHIETIKTSAISNTRTVGTWYTPLAFPRPEAGVAEHLIECDHCKKTVSWRVYSAARVRSVHSRLKGLAALGLILLVGTGTLFFVLKADNGLNSGWVGLAVLGPIVGIVTIICGLAGLVDAVGVRVRAPYQPEVTGVRVRSQYHHARRAPSGTKIVRVPPADPEAGSGPAAESTDG